MSEYDTHEADEVPVHVEARAEEFRAAMPAELRSIVLEGLADLVDALAPGADGSENDREAWGLALAEFEADLRRNPRAFDRRDVTDGLASPVRARVDHAAEAERLIASTSGYPPHAPELLGIVALAQVHATLATIPRPSAGGSWPRVEVSG